MLKRWFGTTLLLMFSALSLAPSVRAQSITNNLPWGSPEEIRTQYSKMVSSISDKVPSSDQSAWAVT